MKKSIKKRKNKEINILPEKRKKALNKGYSSPKIDNLLFNSNTTGECSDMHSNCPIHVDTQGS